MEFTIYRGSWRRGGDGAKTILESDGSDGGFAVSFVLDELYGGTQLLNDRNMMCCLGQIACEAGVPLEQLRDESEPYTLAIEFSDQLNAAGLAYIDDDSYDEYKRLCNTELANDCMPINDDSEIDDAAREEKLIAAFAEEGHTLTFVDGVAPWFEATT
jgi:hypothetical protein